MRYFLLILSLILSACNPFGGTAPEKTPQRVTLRASQTEGDTPFAVTFTAEASPAVNGFNWTVGGERQAETSSTFQTTFERSGVYVVSVSVDSASDSASERASDSVTITVKAPDAPNTGPGIGDPTLTATPGGPAPWAVRYTVKADVDLSGSPPGLEARCAENRNYQQVMAGSFICVHNDADVVEVRFVVADETVSSAEIVPDITQNNGVAFAGRWRYTSRGVTETFRIVRGSETVGESADRRFKLFTLGQQGGLIVEFTIDGRTVVLTPTPGDDGEQLYEGDVYGLVLEPLSSKPDKKP